MIVIFVYNNTLLGKERFQNISNAVAGSSVWCHDKLCHFQWNEPCTK